MTQAERDATLVKIGYYLMAGKTLNSSSVFKNSLGKQKVRSDLEFAEREEANDTMEKTTNNEEEEAAELNKYDRVGNKTMSSTKNDTNTKVPSKTLHHVQNILKERQNNQITKKHINDI